MTAERGAPGGQGPEVALGWRGKRVLVTGATGFIGRHLCAALAQRGAELHATSRKPPEGAGDGGTIRWHRLDPCDRAAVEALVGATAPAVLFHLSSLANAKRDVELVVPTFEAEVVSTLHVLLAVRGRPGFERLVLPASMEEPEAGEAPSSPYAAAKAASRAYARMFHALYETPVVLTRIFMTYGPGQPDWKLIPYLLRSFHEGRSPAVGSGARAVDWIYVEDVVEGVLAAASAPGAVGRLLDVGSGRAVTIRELAETLRRIVGSDLEIDYGSGAPRANEVVRRADLAETLRVAGWAPRIALEQGLERTAEAFASARHR